MINNRQAGRRRGRGGNNNGQRQGGAQGNGSRIDNRARGNASQLYEKYKSMAADAQRSGDRVNTEYYLQFADHYFRVLSEQRGRFEDQQPRRPSGDFDGEGDDEYGDEGEPIRGREQSGEQGEAPRYDNRDRDNRDRDDRPRAYNRDDGRGVEGRNGDGRRDWQDRDRADRDRPDGNRAEGNRPDRDRSDGNRPERDRQDGYRPRERRPFEAPVEVAGQHRAEAVAPGGSLDRRADEMPGADRPLDAPARPRRGRPRREDAAESNGGANGADGGFGADRLPPSISLAANDAEPAQVAPRRRRARPADDTPTAAE